MNDYTVARRAFLKGTGAAALSAAIDTPDAHAQAPLQQPAPNSSGGAAPKLAPPANACDCHMHIYNSRFPAATSAPHPEHAHAEEIGRAHV